MKSIITAIIVAGVIAGSAGAASLLIDGSKLKNHSVPVTKLTASAVSPSWRVAGTASASTSVTGRWSASEKPKSARATPKK